MFLYSDFSTRLFIFDVYEFHFSSFRRLAVFLSVTDVDWVFGFDRAFGHEQRFGIRFSLGTIVERYDFF